VTSASPFTQRGLIEPAPDAAAVNARLAQSTALGQNLSALGQALDTLLRRVPGISAQPVAQKILLATQMAATNPSTTVLLRSMSRVHPGLALSLGESFSEPSAVLTTYEVREMTPATGTAAQVIGRVTIAPNAPVILPAPGRPFQVVTNHPSDDLLVRLRWGTPDTLRRLSLLGYGYNVWRLPRGAAEASGFHLTPPTRAQLRTGGFTRINEAPLPALRDYNTASGSGAADDPADPITAFCADDNGRSVGLPPFADGAEFYYFVTARDLLGRDGDPSPGRLARACRRVRPSAPTEVQVRNDVRIVPLGGNSVSNEQRLLVTWAPVNDASSPVNEYWIYRWPNPAMVFTNDTLPMSNRVGVIGHVANTNVLGYRDTSAGAPVSPGLSTYSYTVRAVSLGACDPLLSPHGGPASAVLREREGPEAATGSVAGSCGAPVVYSDSARIVAVPGLEPARHYYRFTCTRRDSGIAWVRFYYSNVVSSAVEFFGGVYFPPGGSVVELDQSKLPDFAPHNVEIGCVVGSFYGQVSRPGTRSLANAPAAGTKWEVSFQAGLLLNTALNSSDPFYLATSGPQPFCVPAINPSPDPSGTVRMQFDVTRGTPLLIQASSNGVTWADIALTRPDANGYYSISYPACLIAPLPQFRGCLSTLADPGDCLEHIVGTAGGQVAPIRVRFRPTPRTREFRIYRQVNGGPLTLLAQGAAAYDPAREIVRNDDTMPPSASALCYYVQLLDEHGNASPMSFLGCLQAKPEKPPRPVLAEPKAAGEVSAPKVALSWFCPTAGVSRFEIRVRRADQNESTGEESGFTGATLIRNVYFDRNFTYAGLARHGNSYARYDEGYFTPPIGPGFGPGPQFTYLATVQPRVPYKITVLAQDRQGASGEASQEWDFTWTPPETPVSVPWPFRPIPPVTYFDDLRPFVVFEPFLPRVSAVQLTYWNGTAEVIDLRAPVGIRIGYIPPPNDPPDTVGTTNEVFLFPDQNGAPYDPNSRVFRRIADDPARQDQFLLPIVVYRLQETNAAFPKASGDLVQVTPLIERIAWRDTGGNGTYIPDRLIAIMYESGGFCDCALRFLYVRDTQPVMLGARYHYYVVRFNGRREPDEIIDAGRVTIPTTL
jgi:hypothetical protein